ncbi:hemolysin family protein [Janthinobacterium sp.]|uniref:hemolysin family protein n=1 Tax=Janthinobacterium sp. TaxID=1871054 RepID=UPI00293D48A0|nr:hemolysin family protein [Janthinobacterium sp.]
MTFINNISIIGVLIGCSAFFSSAEISLAAARKLKLQLLAGEGDRNAEKVLALQAQPGHFFTVVQIGLNAVAILGGILGEAAFPPYIAQFIREFYDGGPGVETASFLLSFLFVTSLFILIADLIPKRLAMIAPERVALVIIQPMLFCIRVFKPAVLFFNGLANLFFRLCKVSTVRNDDITSADIVAMIDAGAQAGVLHKREHHLIENVFELETRTVTASMTQRDSIIFFSLHEGADSIRQKITEHPHSTFLVCNDGIDEMVGCVDSKDILLRLLNQRSLAISELTIRSALVVPDTLTLWEVLSRFKSKRDNFAVILNEYALVVGVITLTDVLSTLMGNMVSQSMEEQIVSRDANSWLVDGLTPVQDVQYALDIAGFPDDENYETIAGFILYMLRKIPKRTDWVEHAGFKFEVVDIDNNRIDQLLVTRLAAPAP